MAAPDVTQLIRALAPKYGIDPAAAIAVARTEGGLGWGAVGDSGSSFGPFQLHVGGALPKGRDAAWANSPAGIEYALQTMSAAGAKGLTGQQAVDTIVRKFERPADPDSEVAKATGYLGSAGAGAVAAPAAQPQVGQAVAPVAAQQQGSVGGGSSLVQMLLGRSQARRGRQPSALLEQLLSQQQTAAPAAVSPVAAPAVAPPVAAPEMPQASAAGSAGGLHELFYDPLGAYDEGNWINPIGGHSDHVHASFGTPQAALYGIGLAKQMGLRASENPYAEGSPAEPGVHTKTSYHYRNFPGQYGGKQLGMGLDVSGPAKLMSDYFTRLKTNYTKPK